ncbi:MAG: amylo-alpha-1,6-glucosidase [Actinomycetota bacterium]
MTSRDLIETVVSPEGERYEPLTEAGRELPTQGDPLMTEVPGRLLATKEGETFVLSDPDGNLSFPNSAGMGVYYKDTRFLSHYEMRVNGAIPILLSSSAERAYMTLVDLTNPDVWEEGRLTIPQQTLNIRRIRVAGRFVHERLRVKSYHAEPVRVSIEFSLSADFADIFEVRGLRREHRGTMLTPKIEGSIVKFGYAGTDNVFRQMWVRLGEEPAEASVEGGFVRLRFELLLGPHQTRMLSITFEPIVGADRREPLDFETAVARTRRSYQEWERGCTQIKTNNELFDALLQRGVRDLRALLTTIYDGQIMAAGIPWYVAPFGRDSILTSYEILMINPEPARQTLRLLGGLQGEQVDPWRDEEPGKILHEIRQGELANARYVPHTPYFGTVDATPLYLMLAAAYWRWTHDLETILDLRPTFDRALEWIDRYGDADGDGYVEYLRRSPRGLKNQGWKDSGNSIVHADGTLAPGPIALAEVQAYVYMAKRRMAEIYEALGEPDRAAALQKEAGELKAAFDRDFWVDHEQYFALALDGEKRPVETVTSNPAHGLYCDLIEPAKAEVMAKRLLAPDMFSGWGIRTMSKGAVAYNPMSYHNGSIWPHDNAFIAAGLKRYGNAKATSRVATALFDTAMHMEYYRLPELFCGFTRRTPTNPVAYPVACSPQAWAAASPFLLLQAMLGLSARADQNVVTVNQPILPPWLQTVELRNLRIGRSRLSLMFTREQDVTTFSLLSKEGKIRVVMEE